MRIASWNRLCFLWRLHRFRSRPQFLRSSCRVSPSRRGARRIEPGRDRQVDILRWEWMHRPGRLRGRNRLPERGDKGMTVPRRPAWVMQAVACRRRERKGSISCRLAPLTLAKIRPQSVDATTRRSALHRHWIPALPECRGLKRTRTRMRDSGSARRYRAGAKIISPIRARARRMFSVLLA